jgi:hypothetical protein
MFLDKGNSIVLSGVQRQFFRRDFRRLQFQIDVIGGPCSPVKPPVEVSPFVGVFCADEPKKDITAQVNALDAFLRNFDHRLVEFMLADNEVSRALDAAWSVVKALRAPDDFVIPKAFALEQVLAF